MKGVFVFGGFGFGKMIILCEFVFLIVKKGV